MSPIVMVDGQEYGPIDHSMPTIGVAVTTRNRVDVLSHTLEQIREFTPGARVFVVDDGSAKDWLMGPDTYHFTENVGIARAKNKCLEMMYEAGIEHMFLFDDDAYPMAEGWWKGYVDSPEPHLMRIFKDLAGPNKLNDISEVYNDGTHVAYTGPRGIMLYVERRVLDVVGGMDLAYGKWGYEHGDWSGRIHNAGLTTWRFADLTWGGDLIYSMDEHEEIDRTVDRHERKELVRKNVQLYRANWNSSKYMEFRELRNVVLTCLYTGKPDPQRPRAKKLEVDALIPLVESMKKAPLVVMTDEQGTSLPGATMVRTTMAVPNLYIQRWYDYWQYLRDNRDVGFVWCVDGTDVEMLRDPFTLEPDRLYLGSETTTLASGWMERNLNADLQRLVTSQPGATMFNAGLVGGSRRVVMEFIHDLIKMYSDNAIDTAQRQSNDLTATVNDMGILNLVAYSEKWHGRIIAGPGVNTVFKGNERNTWSRWKHK